jgi:hemoglobin/transferrin/lactoferrin receptor protein
MKMNRSTHWAVLICLLLLPELARADIRSVSGQVVSEVTGLPIQGARVDVVNSPLSTATGEDGRFSLDRIPSTASAIRAIAERYEPTVIRIAQGRDDVSLLQVRLRPQLRFDQSVVVAANREEAERVSVPRSVSVLTGAEIARMMPRTTPEALMDLPGVLVQKTNHGGGSPYIRGLVGNHVLVLVDGIRLNNATFRYGPNQYLATIDPGQIERIEVVHGSGSVLFGSDAVGGVINIVTKRPALSSSGFRLSGGASGKLVSSSMERSGRFEVTASGARAAVMGGVSLRDYGDLRAGGNLGIEAPSGYGEFNGDARALIRFSPAQTLELGVQQVYQHDVPRFDQVAQRGFARYSFDPQIRRLGFGRWQHSGSGRWLQTLTASLSYHQSVERRERQQRGSPTQITEQDDSGVAGASVEVRSTPAAFWSIVSGIDYTHDNIGSWRRDVDMTSGSVVDKRGLYPDGATASSAAVFTHSSARLGRTIIDAGIRFSQYSVSATDRLFGSLNITPRAWVGSVAAMHEIGSGVSLVGSISQAFRAPNVDDVSTLGAFDFGVEVPSTEIAPETSVAYEAGIRVLRPAVSGSLVAYRTNLSDLIDRVRSDFQGLEIFEGQRVYRRANVGRAHVYGFEADARWDIAARLGVVGNLTYTYGQQETTGQPMRRIPPLNGLVGGRWLSSSQVWAEGSVRFAAKQDRLASGDLDDHRIPSGGTPGWIVVNASAGFPLLDSLDLVGGFYNIFDEAYRIHGSGIDGYGRSVWVGTHLRF